MQSRSLPHDKQSELQLFAHHTSKSSATEPYSKSTNRASPQYLSLISGTILGSNTFNGIFPTTIPRQRPFTWTNSSCANNQQSTVHRPLSHTLFNGQSSDSNTGRPEDAGDKPEAQS
jgi:hypothetical protein